jgi:hypothetical protein
MTFTGDIELKTDKCLDYFRKNLSETVSTSYSIEKEIFNQFRFYRSIDERIHVNVSTDKSASVTIAGNCDNIQNLEKNFYLYFPKT